MRCHQDERFLWIRELPITIDDLRRTGGSAPDANRAGAELPYVPCGNAELANLTLSGILEFPAASA